MKKAALILVALLSATANGLLAQQPGANDPCTSCIEQYIDSYLEEYFSTLDTLIGGFANCPDCVQLWQIDSARSAANVLTHSVGCIDTNQNSGQINLDTIFLLRQFQTVDSTFTQQDLDDAVAINNWLQFNPQANPGIIPQPGCNLLFFYVQVIDTTVLQPNSAILDVSAFHTDSNLCVTSVYGSTFSSLLNCDSILFLPDSAFVGSDTTYYVICDSILAMCDTGIAIVNVLPDSSLLPIASFSQSPAFPVFLCNYYIDVNDYFFIENTSINEDSVYWSFWFTGSNPSCKIFFRDTMRIWFSPGGIIQLTNCYDWWAYLEVCIVASNQFGSNTYCDTLCYISWEGIDEARSTPLQVYPNPVKETVTLVTDERANGGTIQLTDITGKEILMVKLQSKELQLVTSTFSSGLYLVTLTDDKGNTLTRKLIKQ